LGLIQKSVRQTWMGNPQSKQLELERGNNTSNPNANNVHNNVQENTEVIPKDESIYSIAAKYPNCYVFENKNIRTISKASIGKGAYGIVYDAVRLTGDTNEKLALKIIYKSDEETSEEFTDNSINEIALISSLKHANIVHFYESFYVEKDPIKGEPAYCFIMEYCDTNLDKILSESKKPFDFPSVLHILSKIFDALAFMDSRHVVHRDLKPANIFINYNNHPTHPVSFISFHYLFFHFSLL
jgi:hypothetical protein